jgi:hypothetical protein
LNLGGTPIKLSRQEIRNRIAVQGIIYL